MILALILQIITKFISTIMNIISSLFPSVEFTSEIVTGTQAILEISTQALNFVHFIVGDALVIIIPVAGALLAYKYLVYPIIDVIRRLIPFGNL